MNDLHAWRDVHVGFARDGLTIGGLDVWKHQWRRQAGLGLSLPHPAHTHEMNSFAVYEIGDPAQPVRFAATELSNGVWGFYVPRST